MKYIYLFYKCSLKTGIQRNGTNFKISTNIFQVAFHWFLAVNTFLHGDVSKAWFSNNNSLYSSNSTVILASKQPETQKKKVCVSYKIKLSLQT